MDTKPVKVSTQSAQHIVPLCCVNLHRVILQSSDVGVTSRCIHSVMDSTDTCDYIHGPLSQYSTHIELLIYYNHIRPPSDSDVKKLIDNII